MTGKITITINGEAVELAPNQTLLAWLQGTGTPADKIVAEVNGVIVKPEAFKDCKLNAGDQIELIRFVGGG